MADLTVALGFVDVRLHDLRRTGATGIAALGVAPHIASKVLAHKDGGGGAAITARHYNLYAYASEKRDALDRWAAHVRTVAEIADAPSKPEPRKPAAEAARAVPAGGERLWTDLVGDDILMRAPAKSEERLWTDLVEV